MTNLKKAMEVFKEGGGRALYAYHYDDPPEIEGMGYIELRKAVELELAFSEPLKALWAVDNPPHSMAFEDRGEAIDHIAQFGGELRESVDRADLYGLIDKLAKFEWFEPRNLGSVRLAWYWARPSRDYGGTVLRSCSEEEKLEYDSNRPTDLWADRPEIVFSYDGIDWTSR